MPSTTHGLQDVSTDTPTPPPPNEAGAAFAHRAFEAQARRSPGAVALVSSVRAVTYSELNADAEAIARRLRAAGVGPDTRVGVCLERGPALVAALLGVW